MEEKRSQIGLYIAIIALLVGVANIWLGVLPTVELQGKADQLEARMVRVEETADRAWARVKEGPRLVEDVARPEAPPPLPAK
jgi:hypothetical protein